MKRTLVLLMMVSAIISAFGFSAAAAQKDKVLLIIRDGESPDWEYMLTKEVEVMTHVLSEAGFEVEVTSTTGQPVPAGAATLKPDLKMTDVSANDYAGVIIPCLAMGTAEEPVAPNPTSITIVKEAIAGGKPVAAQLGAVNILAKAGVLSGKKYAYYSEEWVEANPELKDGIYSGNGIVRDGKTITSGICPYIAREQELEDGTVELTQALIAEIKGGN